MRAPLAKGTLHKLVGLVVLSLAGATASRLPQTSPRISSPGGVNVGEGQTEELPCVYHTPGVCTVKEGISVKEGGCSACAPPAFEGCTQVDVPNNFLDLTDFASSITCGGSTLWHKAIGDYAYATLEHKGHSMTLEIAHGGVRQQWEDKPGTFIIIKASGRQKGLSVDCEMQAAIQVYICNDRDSAGFCTCTDGEGNPQLMRLTQAAKLTQPESNPNTYCGKWFVGASTTINMLVANMRSVVLEVNTIMSSCIGQDVNTGWVAHGNQQVGIYPDEFIWWNSYSHGCSIAHGQCYWSNVATAQENCAAWPACKALYCSTTHNGGALACYARGQTTSSNRRRLSLAYTDTSFLQVPSRELGAARVALFASQEEAMDDFRI